VFQIGDDLRRQERADAITGFEARAISVEAVAWPRPQSFTLLPRRCQHFIDQEFGRARAPERGLFS
jgi:hypothetical protein